MKSSSGGAQGTFRMETWSAVAGWGESTTSSKAWMASPRAAHGADGAARVTEEVPEDVAARQQVVAKVPQSQALGPAKQLLGAGVPQQARVPPCPSTTAGVSLTRSRSRTAAARSPSGRAWRRLWRRRRDSTGRSCVSPCAQASATDVPHWRTPRPMASEEPKRPRTFGVAPGDQSRLASNDLARFLSSRDPGARAGKTDAPSSQNLLRQSCQPGHAKIAIAR